MLYKLFFYVTYFLTFNFMKLFERSSETKFLESLNVYSGID